MIFTESQLITHHDFVWLPIELWRIQEVKNSAVVYGLFVAVDHLFSGGYKDSKGKTDP